MSATVWLPQPAGTAGPMHAQRLGLAELGFQSARGLERPALGVDQSEVAVVHAGAAHQTAHDLGRIVT